ncbi:MAG: class I SAM-dependent DNA methyltransferase [Bacteroides sp.]|nr:class I SAM-dependent DNA methyltransferase [Bacteroides sp.]
MAKSLIYELPKRAKHIEQKKKAADFVHRWSNRGYEKGQAEPFWMALLRDCYGIAMPEELISFEDSLKVEESKRFVDGRIPATRVMIEQKGSHVDLTKPDKQSGLKEKLTPFQQAHRYVLGLPVSEHPKWIVVCNFREFHIHDMEHPNDPPEVVLLENLPSELHRLQFLVDAESSHVQSEEQVSVKAGKLVGELYDKLLLQYGDTPTEADLRSLNVLCVRLVFCLYAEDANVFKKKKDMFHDYLSLYAAADLRDALIRLFRILDTPEERRSKFERPELLDFPYVNGGLFSEVEHPIEIPMFTDELRTLLLEKASYGFNWSEISPTIFGALFENTLNPQERRKGGMHYTSVENIHKLIGPLFLDDLTEELNALMTLPDTPSRARKLEAYQQKLASIRVLDPACGSGNFLTETFLSLRRLENQVIRMLYHGQTMLGELRNPVKVSIEQFYGIEINDFAVNVGKTAMWIAENQMRDETNHMITLEDDFLPLTRQTHIHNANALRTDWNDIVKPRELSYIVGNPPFAGRAYQTPEQKKEIAEIFTYKDIDYVACWYKKTADYIQGTDIECAFVSTNSITQGEQTHALWMNLPVKINFAHTTFIWESETEDTAAVYCVIIGFGNKSRKCKYIYTDGVATACSNINGYLKDRPDIYVPPRTKPLCDAPEMDNGNVPLDGGALKIEPEELKDFENCPHLIKRLIGGKEVLYNKMRYALWLVDTPISEVKKYPKVLARVEQCRLNRLAMKDKASQKLAERPMTFRDTKNPDNYIAIPAVSGERREYIPMAFFHGDTVCTNQVQTIPNATVYHLGILSSSAHMAWMRETCGRLEMRYRYSKEIVYNSFPWPQTDGSQQQIAELMQEILNIRAAQEAKGDCLADLYDPRYMPPALRRAHKNLDCAVLKLYGLRPDSSETEIVRHLLTRYKQLIGG